MCTNVWYFHNIYMHRRSMQVNVDTCRGGGNWYEKDLHRRIHNKGTNKGYYIYINDLYVWFLR